MRRFLLTAAALALLTTAATAAPTTLYKGGAWETFITTNVENKSQCVMVVLGRGSSLMVKYAGGDIFMQIYKDGWSIPADTKIPGWLQFDNSQRYPMMGAGDMHKPGTGYVEFHVKEGSENGFLDLFAAANKMVLGFDQGTQPPFSVNMNGSRGAALAFGRCAKAIDTPEPQPYAKPAPQAPQPFGKPTQPTAPVKDDGSV